MDTDNSLVRMMRLVKVLRLARASRLINRLTSTWTINSEVCGVCCALYLRALCVLHVTHQPSSSQHKTTL